MKIITKRSSYSLLPRLGLLVNSEIEQELYSLIAPREINEEKIIETLRTNLTDEEIETQLCSNRNLTLNITEECNFRCIYCAYSGIYDNVRRHNPKKMEFHTAKSAVDLFFKLLKNKKTRQKRRTISISFYGGEALLEFNLIRKIVKYAKNEFKKLMMGNTFKLRFRISTNGHLLAVERTMTFLVENSISIDLSLDGPKSEHDKFRLNRNGEKTWDGIWNTLNIIRRKYPTFYDENINILITLHPEHDFNRIDKFFLENQMHFPPDRILANLVNETSLKKNFKNKWFRNKVSKKSKLISSRSIKRLDQKFTLRQVDYKTKFTNMCFPGGMKLFISCDGTIYICERIKQDVPIGNVDIGLNYEVIRKIQMLWNKEIIRNRCWECSAWAFCSVCVAQTEAKEDLQLDCKYKEQVQNTLANYLTGKEEEFETKINSDSQTIKEYIGQL